MSIESADTFVRPIYAGNAIATVRSKDDIKILTIRVSAFAPPAAGDSSANVEDGGSGSEGKGA
jgi:electron transfer flavoprotein alpha subunit